jgi:hypothetical protein
MSDALISPSNRTTLRSSSTPSPTAATATTHTNVIIGLRGTVPTTNGARYDARDSKVEDRKQQMSTNVNSSGPNGNGNGIGIGIGNGNGTSGARSLGSRAQSFNNSLYAGGATFSPSSPVMDGMESVLKQPTVNRSRLSPSPYGPIIATTTSSSNQVTSQGRPFARAASSSALLAPSTLGGGGVTNNGSSTSPPLPGISSSNKTYSIGGTNRRQPSPSNRNRSRKTRPDHTSDIPLLIVSCFGDHVSEQNHP